MVRHKVKTYTIGASIIDGKAALIFFMVVSTFFESWMLMILLGMVAGYIALPGLALGYWCCVVVNIVWSNARPKEALARDEDEEFALHEALTRALGGKK